MPRMVLQLRQSLLDQPHALHSLGARTYVVHVSGTDREHQRIEDQVLLGHPVLLGQQLGRTQRDFQLSALG